MTDPVSETGRGARDTKKFVRLSEEDVRHFFQNAPIGLFLCTPDRLNVVNPALAEMLGWDSADKLCEDRRFGAEFLANCGFAQGPLDEQAESNATRGRRVEFHRRDGSTIAVKLTLKAERSATGTLRGYGGFMEDLTELDRTRGELREAQELAMRGQLAGGIAHDFNNILSGALIHLGLLLQEVEVPAIHKEGLKLMQDEMTRAADLTRQLLSLSRRHAVASMEAVEVNKLVADLLPMLRRVARENIPVVFLPAKEECWIEADAGLIEMLVMHLCFFARREMPQGGTLTLATYLVSENEGARPVQVCLAATQSKPAPLRVATKSGALIAAWKAKNDDSALRAIRDIVDLHHGILETPDPVAGHAPYRILFAEARRSTSPASADEGEEVKGGSETVLLIEDERYLRRASALCLRKLGYAVLEAADDEEALKLWEKHRRKIDVVFTDFLLPGFSTGLELARRMQKEKPTLKIMVASGQGPDFEEALAEGGAGLAHLSKPYSIGEVARALRRCLDEPAASCK